MAESIGNGIDLSGFNGIIKQGSTYTVYGSANLATNLEIRSGETMQIDAGKTLTISEGITLTNEGAIIVENGGALVNKGTIDGSGNVLVDTYYLNTDNETTDQQANLVNTGSTTWTGSDPDGGWYVVQGEVDINSRVNVSGTVNLILADGCNLKINGGINVSSGNSLTIYGQDEGTGALTATGADSQAGIGGGESQSGGAITINGRDIDDYFGLDTLKLLVRQPLVTTDMVGKVDIICTVAGGGVTGQAGAIRHGIARALLELNPEYRAALKSAGFLTRDPRMKERKKYGLHAARRAPQFSKR